MMALTPSQLSGVMMMPMIVMLVMFMGIVVVLSLFGAFKDNQINNLNDQQHT